MQEEGSEGHAVGVGEEGVLDIEDVSEGPQCGGSEEEDVGREEEVAAWVVVEEMPGDSAEGEHDGWVVNLKEKNRRV